MKYCVHYHRNSPFKYFDEIDEIEIRFRKEDTTLPAFLEKYEDKSIIISVENAEDIPLLQALYEKYKNFRIKINYFNTDLVDAVVKSIIPFFFCNFVDNWGWFVGFLRKHPTDMYIVNELGFELDKVAEIAHFNNIKIRVIPNVAQSNWEDTPDMQKFFIRPEDLNIYEPYVDVIEFFGEEKQLSVYYEIYAHDKQWFGKLDEIITNFNSEVDNRGIIPAFAEARVKCGKRCLKGHKCKICERIEHLSKTLTDNHLIVHKAKEND